ncbi:LCP family protein [Streptomyces sp. NPDC013953]|uniref:LCP family protein n=1 Tax=Streptomyces sp. NPDC013953 TaxID=3364868 RepID=UPI0037019BA3
MTDSAGTPAEPPSGAGSEPRRAAAPSKKRRKKRPAGRQGGGAGGGGTARSGGKATPPRGDRAGGAGPGRTAGPHDGAAGPDGHDGPALAHGPAGGPPPPGGVPPAGAPGDPYPQGGRARRWLRWGALGASVLVLVAAGGGWWLYRKLDSNITTDTTAADELARYEKERPSSLVRGARNILLIGSDTRAGDNAKYGRDKGEQRSDTTILLHIAANGRGVTAVSLPRDLMVEVPSCRGRNGVRTRPQFTQFNSAYQLGGTACTIRTVEKMTRIRIDHHMVIDFRGFKDMVDAVGGVRVCVAEPIDDPDAKVRLKRGAQTLRGEQALGYVRARKSLGNGSDTERMDRQQQFLGALVNKVQSNGVLLNPARLYPVLDAATKSITTDPGLDSLKDLYDLARALRSVPTEKVQFLTVPRQPYTGDPNRDMLVQPKADSLFKRLRADAPVVVVSGDKRPGRGKSDEDESSSPSATPTFAGTNAAAGTCGQREGKRQGKTAGGSNGGL